MEHTDCFFQKNLVKKSVRLYVGGQSLQKLEQLALEKSEYLLKLIVLRYQCLR